MPTPSQGRARLSAWDETLILIRARLTYTRRRCFRYEGLHATYQYLFRRGVISHPWNSIERVVRRMAEMGVIERVVRARNDVFFCVDHRDIFADGDDGEDGR